MPWIEITFDTLKGYLVAEQLAAMESAALGEGQDSPFDEVAPGVISRIRAEIATCAKNILDEDENKIPQSLKTEAAALIIEAMQPRILIALTEDQRRAADNARSYLKRISLCEVRVPDVEQTGAFQSTSGSPAITDKCLRNQREDSYGL